MELNLTFYEEAKALRLKSIFPTTDFYFQIGSTDEFSGLFHILNVLYDRGIFVTMNKDGKRLELIEVLNSVHEHPGLWRGVYINFSCSGRWMPYISSTPNGICMSASGMANSIKQGW